MLSIKNTKFIRFDSEGNSVERAELSVDTTSDLPEADGLNGRVLYQGSIAWDISTGDFYGLNSLGQWVNQRTGDIYSGPVWTGRIRAEEE